MRFQGLLIIAAVSILCCEQAFSGTVAGVGVRDSAVIGTLEKWSVGVSGEWMKRDVKESHGGEIGSPEVTTVSLFLGYDVKNWLTMFATLGGTEIKPSSSEEYGGEDVKFSGGLQGNLWRTEITDPEFMMGSLTLKSIVEISSYQFSGDGSDVNGNWTEYSIAFPFCYEIFAERRESVWQVPYSLALLAGPSLSSIRGRTDNAHFRERKSLGFIGGVDVYFSHNLSIGCQVEYYDHASMSASMTYHF
jgi:opacity protein-like surface antigen